MNPPTIHHPEDAQAREWPIFNQASLLSILSECGGLRRKSSRLWAARKLIADSLLE